MIIAGQNLDDLPQVLSYNGDNTVAYIQVVVLAIPGSYPGGTYRKTFTYTGGNVTAISAWTLQ